MAHTLFLCAALVSGIKRVKGYPHRRRIGIHPDTAQHVCRQAPSLEAVCHWYLCNGNIRLRYSVCICHMFQWQFICSIRDEFQFVSGVDGPLGSGLEWPNRISVGRDKSSSLSRVNRVADKSVPTHFHWRGAPNRLPDSPGYGYTRGGGCSESDDCSFVFVDLTLPGWGMGTCVGGVVNLTPVALCL